MLIAQDTKGLLESANAAYESSSYSDAIQQYTKVIDFGYQSLAVYNNLGSALYKSGDIPSAILYFEKGLKMDPFDKSILHNLSIAKEQLDSDIVQIPEFIVFRVWKYLFTRAGSNTWYFIGFISIFLSVFAFGVWLLHSERLTKKKGFLGGIAFFVLSILFFFLSSSQAKFQYRLKTGIIMKDQIELKSAPEEANEAIMSLLPGTKVQIVDKIGSFEKVRLENGQLGWLPAGQYHII